jgi:hypothetical protein
MEASAHLKLTCALLRHANRLSDPRGSPDPNSRQAPARSRDPVVLSDVPMAGPTALSRFAASSKKSQPSSTGKSSSVKSGDCAGFVRISPSLPAAANPNPSTGSPARLERGARRHAAPRPGGTPIRFERDPLPYRRTSPRPQAASGKIRSPPLAQKLGFPSLTARRPALKHGARRAISRGEAGCF